MTKGIKARRLLLAAITVLLIGLLPGAVVRAEEVHDGDLQIKERVVLENPLESIRNRANASIAEYATADSSGESDYFYNRLSLKQQSLYRAMKSKCNTLLTSGGQLTRYEGKYTTGFVSFESGLSGNDAVAVGKLIMTNCPQFYFLSEQIFISGNSMAITVYDDFSSQSSRANATAQINTRVNWYLNQARSVSGNLQREKKIHDLIISNNNYSFGKYNQSIAGIFLENKAVCAGYSEAFQLLCNKLGIETISIVSETHEWNKVYINGSWTNVDVTNSGLGGTRFNVPDSNLSSRMYIPEDWIRALGIPGAASGRAWIYDGVDYSAVFDPDYYASRYSDLRAVFGSNSALLLDHFVSYGVREGRQGKASFDVYSYKRQYPDLRAAFGNYLPSYYYHYISYGNREGRAGTGCTTLRGAVTTYGGVNYSAVYDYSVYSTYGDLKRAFGEDDVAMLSHFVNYGMSEGRKGNSTFDVRSYRLQYADLRSAFGSNLASYYYHYISYGRREGRAGTGCTTLRGAISSLNGVNYSAVYDYNVYSTYGDLKRAFGDNDVAMLNHFISYGMAEGRTGSNSFKLSIYKSRYADLRAAFGNDNAAYYYHYINYGRREGRRAV